MALAALDPGIKLFQAEAEFFVILGIVCEKIAFIDGVIFKQVATESLGHVNVLFELRIIN
jgi:hypothetical protein